MLERKRPSGLKEMAKGRPLKRMIVSSMEDICEILNIIVQASESTVTVLETQCTYYEN
jgi:hypothetical protein